MWGWELQLPGGEQSQMAGGSRCKCHLQLYLSCSESLTHSASTSAGLMCRKFCFFSNNILKHFWYTLSSVRDLSHLKNRSILLLDTRLSLISDKYDTDNTNFCRPCCDSRCLFSHFIPHSVRIAWWGCHRWSWSWSMLSAFLPYRTGMRILAIFKALSQPGVC